MSGRVKDEIKAKQERLAALRAARQNRQQGDASPSTGSSPSLRSDSPQQSISEVNEWVDQLISKDATETSRSRVTSGTVPETAKENVDPTSNTMVIQDVFDIAPKRVKQVKETYSKEVQTDSVEDEDEEEAPRVTVESKPEEPAELPQSEPEPEDEPEQDTRPALRPLDPDGGMDNTLEKFLDQSWKVITRAMDDDYDILINYSEQADDAPKTDTQDQIATQSMQWYSDLSKGRAITGIDWSSKFPELVVSSHTQKNNDPQAPKGLVQIWNMHVKSRPEYVFNAQSDVLNVRFSPFEPNLLFGTAYNGQVLTWDIRTRTPDPVLKSPLTGYGHSHPIYSVQVTGTQNANNLVTASTDGTVCTWTPDLLAKPQDRVVLTNPAVARNDEVSPTSLSMSPKHPTQFVVGTEEGAIYQCNRYDQAGSRAGVDTRGAYRGHLAPVTALGYHSSKGAIDLGDYMLSSSLDWSVKLWKTAPFSGDGTKTNNNHNDGTTQQQRIAPLMDFKRDDMVYDVSWSPAHPAVFGCVDGSGYLELWNMNRDVEVPWTRVKPSSGAKSHDRYLSRALNKLSWSVADESAAAPPPRVAVGGLDGTVTVFDVALQPPAPEDWSTFKRVLSQYEE